MHFSKIALAAAVSGSVSAASSPSICDKYTVALLKENTAANQYALVSLLVKTAGVGNFTGPGSMNPTLPGSMVDFPGFLAPTTVGGVAVNLKPYFDGSLLSTNVNGMPGSVNWLDSNTTLLVSDPLSLGEPGTHTLTLLTHLVQLFGALLGCSTYGTTGFAKYAGDNSQYNVHKFMDLSEAEFTNFVLNVGMSAKSFGASATDIMAAATALNTTFGYRCAPAATVAPGTPAELQAICIDSSCPMAPNATCSGVPTPSEPATASSAMMSATATGAMTSTSASSSVMPFNPNSASKKTGAGIFAAVGAVVAALL